MGVWRVVEFRQLLNINSHSQWKVNVVGGASGKSAAITKCSFFFFSECCWLGKQPFQTVTQFIYFVWLVSSYPVFFVPFSILLLFSSKKIKGSPLSFTHPRNIRACRSGNLWATWGLDGRQRCPFESRKGTIKIYDRAEFRRIEAKEMHSYWSILPGQWTRRW